MLIEIAERKTQLISFLKTTEPDDDGFRLASFRYNGTIRTIKMQDNSVKATAPRHKKAPEPGQKGAPLQGNLSSSLVTVGDQVKVNQTLFTIEAMKMKSTVVSPMAGTVKQIFLSEKTLMEQDDAVVEIGA